MTRNRFNFHKSALKFSATEAASLQRLKDNPVDDNDRTILDANLKITPPLEMHNDEKERHRYATVAAIQLAWCLAPASEPKERDRLVSQQIPKNCESFLDIGSCKGYYVCKTARNAHCKVAAGIDIHKPFIDASEEVSRYLGLRNTHFYLTDIDKLSDDPEAFGGPFQVILLIGTYQYLFWGSGLNMKAFYSHREILSRLAGICTKRLILSARLEARWLSGGIKEKAELLKKKIPYNTSNFLEAAGEFFRINKTGYLGKYPLFVMEKKTL